jgi:hypothetical protein
MDIDHTFTKEIVCPWCGYSFEDDEYTYSDQDSHDIHCDECDQDFVVCANIETTYSTTRKECAEGECDYSLENTEMVRNPYIYKGKNWCIWKCKVCQNEKILVGTVKDEPYVIPLDGDNIS